MNKNQTQLSRPEPLLQNDLSLANESGCVDFGSRGQRARKQLSPGYGELRKNVYADWSTAQGRYLPHRARQIPASFRRNLTAYSEGQHLATEQQIQAAARTEYWFLRRSMR